ncbi:MAG: cysteine hydrolase [Desulfobacterales bacterium]|nr:MAG: cysteine hydrolase [Desulfobacterales bacterium]
MAAQVDVSKSAVLVMHTQNDITHPDGKFAYSGVPAQVAKHRIWDNLAAFLDSSRKAGMLVIYIKVALRPGHPELSPKSYPIHAGGRKVGAWTEGTWGAEIVDELKPQEEDIVITNYSPNVFLYTNLDQILRAKKIENLFLTGTATNFVVEEAARYGAQIGYDIATVEDCCTSFTDEMHAFSIKNILPQFGAISKSQDVIASLTRAVD